MNILCSDTKVLFGSLFNEPKVQKYLNFLKQHHLDSYEHSCRVSLLSIDLGYENNFNSHNMRILGCGALLHDIGKTKIPKQVLSKPSKLEPEEKKLMESHPRYGFLEVTDLEYAEVRIIIISHHEYKIDPYPRKTDSGRIIIPAGGFAEKRKYENGPTSLVQMVAVADMYDALANKRAYKEPMAKEVIEEIIRKQYTGNPKYVDQIMKRH